MKISPEIKQAISNASKTTGVSEQMLNAFAEIESGFDPGAISKTNVHGIFQITRGTWKDIWTREGRPNTPYSTKPTEQALAAAYQLKWLAPKLQYDQNLIAIGYNAGLNVARELIGKDLTKENIQYAIAKHLKNARSDKAQETASYPVRLAKALGQEFKVGPGSSTAYNNDKATSDLNQPTPIINIDKNKSFFANLMQNSAMQIKNFEIVTAEHRDPQMLRSVIRNSPKLHKLLDRAREVEHDKYTKYILKG